MKLNFKKMLSFLIAVMCVCNLAFAGVALAADGKTYSISTMEFTNTTFEENGVTYKLLSDKGDPVRSLDQDTASHSGVYRGAGQDYLTMQMSSASTNTSGESSLKTKGRTAFNVKYSTDENFVFTGELDLTEATSDVWFFLRGMYLDTTNETTRTLLQLRENDDTVYLYQSGDLKSTNLKYEHEKYRFEYKQQITPEYRAEITMTQLTGEGTGTVLNYVEDIEKTNFQIKSISQFGFYIMKPAAPESGTAYNRVKLSDGFSVGTFSFIPEKREVITEVGFESSDFDENAFDADGNLTVNANNSANYTNSTKTKKFSVKNLKNSSGDVQYKASLTDAAGEALSGKSLKLVSEENSKQAKSIGFEDTVDDNTDVMCEFSLKLDDFTQTYIESSGWGLGTYIRAYGAAICGLSDADGVWKLPGEDGKYTGDTLFKMNAKEWYTFRIYRSAGWKGTDGKTDTGTKTDIEVYDREGNLVGAAYGRMLPANIKFTYLGLTVGYGTAYVDEVKVEKAMASSVADHEVIYDFAENRYSAKLTFATAVDSGSFKSENVFFTDGATALTANAVLSSDGKTVTILLPEDGGDYSLEIYGLTQGETAVTTVFADFGAPTTEIFSLGSDKKITATLRNLPIGADRVILAGYMDNALVQARICTKGAVAGSFSGTLDGAYDSDYNDVRVFMLNKDTLTPAKGFYKYPAE